MLNWFVRLNFAERTAHLIKIVPKYFQLWQFFLYFYPKVCICGNYSIFCFPICDSVSVFRLPMFLFVTDFVFFSSHFCICDSYSVFCFPHVFICDSVSVFRFPKFLSVTVFWICFFQCLYLWQLFCIGKRWKILPRDPEQGTLARNILIHKLKTFSYLQIIWIHKLKTVSYSQIILREGSRCQIGWIFGKIPNSLWPPPLIFGKLYWKSFITDMVAFMQGGIGQIVPANISQYHFISIQWLKKHSLNPEITHLFVNFMLKKSCLKFPKSAIYFIGLKMTPPPPLWHFSKKSSDLVAGSFPYLQTQDIVLFTNHLNPQTEDIFLFKESFLPTNHSLLIAPTIILS